MYDNETPIQSFTVNNSTYPLRKTPQQTIHHAIHKAKIKAKAKTKTSNQIRRLQRIIAQKPTPKRNIPGRPTPKRISVPIVIPTSSSTSSSVVIELTDPSSSSDRQSNETDTEIFQDIEPQQHNTINAKQFSTPTLTRTVTLTQTLQPHTISLDNQLNQHTIPNTQITIPKTSAISRILTTPTDQVEESTPLIPSNNQPSLISTSIAAIPRLTTQLLNHIADNITVPSISPAALLQALMPPSRASEQQHTREITPEYTPSPRQHRTIPPYISTAHPHHCSRIPVTIPNPSHIHWNHNQYSHYSQPFQNPYTTPIQLPYVIPSPCINTPKYTHHQISPYSVNQHSPRRQHRQGITRPLMIDTHTQTEIIHKNQETQTEWYQRCANCEWQYRDSFLSIESHEIRHAFEI